MRVARVEGWLVFLASAAVCLVAGLAALREGRADWDALAALSHALDVVHKEPRFNLALIGFVAPPLPALSYLPFCGLTPNVATSGLACPLLGCVMLGLSAAMLNALGAEAGLPRYLRWPLVAVFVLHPLVLSLGALGGPGSILTFTILGSAWALVRWSRDESFRDLLTCSLFLTAAVLTRYEAVWLAITAAAFVTWRTHRKGEGWSRTEGTLIAFALPLGYSAAVWIGSNWAILGDPWHFWRATIGSAPEAAISAADWGASILWVALICCPLLFGLMYHEIRGVGPAREGRRPGRAAAWLVLGTALGAGLSPTLHFALGDTHWQRLLTLGVAATAIGYALLALVVGQYLSHADKGARRPIAGSLLLAAVGIALVAWLQDIGGVGLPATPRAALRGNAAFADFVAPERDAATIIEKWLAPGGKVYVVGPGPGFAISLFSGHPAQFVVQEAPTIANLPLEVGDLLAVRGLLDYDRSTPDIPCDLTTLAGPIKAERINAVLRARYLEPYLLSLSSLCEQRWTVFRMRRPLHLP